MEKEYNFNPIILETNLDNIDELIKGILSPWTDAASAIDENVFEDLNGYPAEAAYLGDVIEGCRKVDIKIPVDITTAVIQLQSVAEFLNLRKEDDEDLGYNIEDFEEEDEEDNA